MITFLVASLITTPPPNRESNQVGGIPYLQCFIDSSKKYGLELPLLLAVAEKESKFNSYAFNNNNDNGSFDIGIMQVNSFWLEKYGLRKETMFDACENIKWGAYIMADAIYNYGYSWRGVGKYNAKSEYKGYLYSLDLSVRYERFYRCLKRHPLPKLSECSK